MVGADGDDLIRFPDAHVIRATVPAMLCAVAGKRVWIARRHVSGKLWCAGDRGTLFIRRSVALDRQLLGDVAAAADFSLGGSSLSRRRGARLRLVRAPQR